VFEAGELAEKVTTALENAARRGVQVDMVLDEIGSSKMDPAHDERLRKAGCHIVSLNAPHWYELEELNYRTHRKILVVDGQVGFAGGVGVADHWLGHAQDREHWRDTHIRVRGPIVQFLEGSFYENFAESGAIITPVVDTVRLETGDERGASILLRSAPTGGSSDLKRLYLLAIAMARRSVDRVEHRREHLVSVREHLVGVAVRELTADQRRQIRGRVRILRRECAAKPQGFLILSDGEPDDSGDDPHEQHDHKEMATASLGHGRRLCNLFAGSPQDWKPRPF